jgi:hypothetical protein
LPAAREHAARAKSEARDLASRVVDPTSAAVSGTATARSGGIARCERERSEGGAPRADARPRGAQATSASTNATLVTSVSSSRAMAIQPKAGDPSAAVARRRAGPTRAQ